MRSYQAPVSCQSLIFTMKAVCENSKIVTRKELHILCDSNVLNGGRKSCQITQICTLCHYPPFNNGACYVFITGTD
jgi:hypothetical protein